MKLLNLIRQSGSTTLARVSSTATVLAIMAIAARRFDAEQFGVWAILYSLLPLIAVLDLGCRSALGNRLAALGATPDSLSKRRLTFLAVFHFQLLVAAGGVLVCWAVLPRIDWSHLFKIQQAVLRNELGGLMTVSCALMVAFQPFSLAGTALFADRKVEFVSIISVVQSVLLATIFFFVADGAHFHSAVVIFFSSYLATGVLITAGFFRLPNWRWSWTSIREQLGTLQSLSRPAIDFFFLGFTGICAATLAPMIVGAAGGAISAGKFSVLQKLFGVLATVHLSALAPLGPAFTFHASQGDWLWIEQKLKFAIRVIWPSLFIGGAGIILLAHPMIMRAWTGVWIRDYPLAGALAAGIILIGWSNTHSVLLNSLGVARIQAALAMIMLPVAILLPIWLGRWGGGAGVAFANSLCVVPACVVTWREARRVIHRRHLNV